MRAEVRREILRKILHMAMGLFGLCLRWLSPWQAALCALAALAHNLWIFPHYGMRKLERPKEKARGYSGMIGYPAIVLVVIVLCWNPGSALLVARGAGTWRHTMAVAAAAWAVLAFGDAAATLFGMALKGLRIHWNPDKTWAGWLGFVVVGSPLSALWFCLVAGIPLGEARWRTVLVTGFAAALLAGLVETLPGQVDDNLAVPLMAWLTFSFLNPQGLDHLRGAMAATFNLPGAAPNAFAARAALLVVNVALGLTAYRLRWVGKASCALGIAFGCAVIVGMGWKGYGFLLLFYVVSQLSTFYGKKTKARRGIAEPDEGRRGVGSVFSKGLMPALFALVSPLACVAALATYAADTVASEVGKASMGPAHLLFRRRPVEAGTVGAVSRAGNVAGLCATVVFVAAAAVMSTFAAPRFFLADDNRVFAGGGSMASVGWIDLSVLLLSLFVACTLAFFSESLLNEKVVSRGWISKELGHLFIGGLAGSLAFGVAGGIAALVQILT